MALPGRALPSRARRPSPRPQPRRRGARPRPPLRRTARDRDRAPRHALVHDVDQATLTEAAETLAACGARLEHARALIDLGSAIRRTGKRAHAPKALAEGADLAQRCGATALVDHARHGLRLAGDRPRVAQTGRDALTPAEAPHRRARRQGDTNKQIAQALFVPLRTVEMHLSNSHRKLDIETREQLPAALTDSPLLPATLLLPDAR
jgi:DNA-binding CsgD family transcriptional regulator